MKLKFLLCLAVILSGILSGCATKPQPARQYDVSRGTTERSDILSYSKASSNSMRQIIVTNISLSKVELDKLNSLPKNKTENGVRWLVEEKPDTMRNAPWNTRLYIFDNSDRNHCVLIELMDHGNGGVRYNWLNDKMLFVRVWFGRIAWTDFILNSESLRFSYIEDGRLDQSMGPNGS